MGQYLGRHELSSIGKTTSRSFSGSTANVELVANVSTANVPIFFLIRSDQDCHLRQGGTSVEADANDFLLKKDTYMKIAVRSSLDNYIAAIQDSTSGTLYCTELTSDDPATGASS